VAGVGGTSCFVASDCPPFVFCVDDMLVTNASVCAGHTCDYAPAQVVTKCPGTCAAGACVDACTVAADCGPPTYQCGLQGRVRRDTTCVAGACHADVVVADPCDAGLACVDGACVPQNDAGPVIACTVPLDCPIPPGTCVCDKTMSAFGAPSCTAGLCAWDRYEAYCHDGCTPGICSQGLP
jgi:hypothetical protein